MRLDDQLTDGGDPQPKAIHEASPAVASADGKPRLNGSTNLTANGANADSLNESNSPDTTEVSVNEARRLAISNPAEARRFIDAALERLPGNDELNRFSNMLASPRIKARRQN